MKPLVAVAFASCEDLVLSAIPLVQNFDFPDLNKALTQCFQRGISKQIRISSQNFALLKKQAEKIGRRSLGGTGVTMARRAALQGAELLIGCQLTQFFNQLYFRNNSRALKIVECLQDCHIALQFKEGDIFRGVAAKASSRLYVNSDTLNYLADILPQFFETVGELNPQLIILGGFQLLSDHPNLKQIFVQFKRAMEREKGRVHVQLSDFSNQVILDYIMDSVFPYADSLGGTMNEFQLVYGRLDCERPFDLTNFVLGFNQKISKRLSRVHSHSLRHQIVYRPDSWLDATRSLLRGVKVSFQVSKQPCDYDERDIVREIKQGLVSVSLQIKVRPGCGSTVGLGDNVSSAGVLAQLPITFVR